MHPTSNRNTSHLERNCVSTKPILAKTWSIYYSEYSFSAYCSTKFLDSSLSCFFHFTLLSLLQALPARSWPYTVLFMCTARFFRDCLSFCISPSANTRLSTEDLANSKKFHGLCCDRLSSSRMYLDVIMPTFASSCVFQDRTELRLQQICQSGPNQYLCIVLWKP